MLMEVINDSDDTYDITYQPWKRYYYKQFAPALVPFSLTLVWLALNGAFPYYWIAVFVSVWILFSSIILNNDMQRESVWSFNRQSRIATKIERRPAHLTKIPHGTLAFGYLFSLPLLTLYITVPLIFPRLGAELRQVPFADLADVLVAERRWNHVLENRIELLLVDQTKVPLFPLYFTATPAATSAMQSVVERLKDIALTRKPV